MLLYAVNLAIVISIFEKCSQWQQCFSVGQTGRIEKMRVCVYGCINGLFLFSENRQHQAYENVYIPKIIASFYYLCIYLVHRIWQIQMCWKITFVFQLLLTEVFYILYFGLHLQSNW